MKRILTIAMVALGLLVANSSLQAQTKIAHINTGDLFQVLPEAKKADSALKAYQQILQKNGEDYQTELEEKAKKFNQDSAKMTAVVKEAERKKLQDLYQIVVNYQQTAQQQLEAKQQELMTPLQKRINDLVTQVAKEGGYTYVFDRQALLVAPDGDDLLPLIKKKLNLK